MKTLCIGFVGLPGAGKTTIGKYLEKQGFTRITLSDFIKEELKKNNISKVSRVILQKYGNYMRNKYGPQILALRAQQKIKAQHIHLAVIDGIRNLSEIALLRSSPSFWLVGIVARPNMRYLRLKQRSIKPLTCSYSKFLSEVEREDKLGSKETGLRVHACLKECDYIINNSGTIEQVTGDINNILNKLL
jgi:dephospho-CoA kinase